MITLCVYRPTDDGAAALGASEELALALSASLRVMQVIEPLARLYGAGEMPLNFPEIDASIYTDTERTVIQRVARLSSRLEAEGTLHSGRPAEVLVGLSETVDLLVIGSRGYGPLKSVLLGGVSGQVIRSAACPVVVVPRGAASAVGSVFAPPSLGRAGRPWVRRTARPAARPLRPIRPGTPGRRGRPQRAA